MDGSAPTGFPSIQSGRYQFVEVLGSGNKGVVYKALDKTLDKLVAIKKLHALTESRHAVKFQREARIVGTLRHPNVMTALDFGLTDKNEPYLVLNYFEGESLSDLIERNGPLPPQNAIPIFLQITSGLSHAHHKNIVHRDIKPSNIMLTNRAGDVPVVQIVDFGLAKAQSRDQGVTTSSGPGVGTPTYMSPEQVRGHKIDGRSDIYSLGCLMFEALTGMPPFQGDTPLETMQMHLNQKPPSLETAYGAYRRNTNHDTARSNKIIFSEELEKIISKCLQKQAGDRYQTIDELAQELLAQIDGAPTTEEAANFDEASNIERMASQPDRLIAAADSKSSNTSKILVLFACGSVILIVLFFGLSATNLLVTSYDIRSNQDTLSPIPEAITESSFPYGGGEQRYLVQGGDAILRGLVLKRYPNMQSLNLEFSSVTPEGLRLLIGSPVKHINWVSRPVTKEHLKSFAEIRTLRHLDFGETRVMDYNDLDLLAVLPELNELTLRKLPLDDLAFKKISTLDKLEILLLQDCTGITAPRLSMLKTLPRLGNIKLMGGDVTDESMHGLFDLNVENIHLKSKYVSDVSLDGIAGMKRAWKIELIDCTRISDRAIEKLRTVRKNIDNVRRTVEVKIKREIKF